MRKVRLGNGHEMAEILVVTSMQAIAGMRSTAEGKHHLQALCDNVREGAALPEASYQDLERRAMIDKVYGMPTDSIRTIVSITLPEGANGPLLNPVNGEPWPEQGSAGPRPFRPGKGGGR